MKKDWKARKVRICVDPGKAEEGEIESGYYSGRVRVWR